MSQHEVIPNTLEILTISIFQAVIVLSLPHLQTLVHDLKSHVSFAWNDPTASSRSLPDLPAGWLQIVAFATGTTTGSCA